MAKRNEHTLWIEKHRIIDIDKYIGSEELVENVRGYIKDNDIPHLLFEGPGGTGKTTLGKLIYKTLDCDHLFLNASDENGIDTIRDKIKAFASTASFKPLKIVMLDEADFLTQPAQAALRNIIEEYSMSTRFILTCNYATKIIPFLKSRCEVFRIIPPSKGDIAKHLAWVLDEEKVHWQMADLGYIVNRYYPDVRSMLKKLQSFSKTESTDEAYDYELIIKKGTSDEDDYQSKIVEILKKPTKKSWYEIRQIIVNQQLDDYQPLYRFLFDNMEEFAVGKEPNIAIILDDCIWRSSLVPDKEIAISSCIAKILDYK